VRMEIKDLTKHFEHTLVLDRINLEIREKEFLGLLGPSGSGKTTLLRILAGLEFPDSGAVLLNSKDALTLPIEERQIGFVFQHYALFNHMSVFENVAFGLKVRPRRRRPSPDAIRKRVQELMELVQLEAFEDRMPAQLSGGQRQRVALARALATDPKVLLLDEPFGALDAKVRIELRRSLRHIHDATGLTTVFVTHDQEEALDLADRVAIMNRGVIEQIGAPQEIYESPRTPFIFDFLGRTNAFPCTIEKGTAKLGDKVLPVDPGTADGRGVAFVRPHDVVLGPANQADAILPGAAIIRFISPLGHRVAVELLYDRKLIEAEISREKLMQLGLDVGDKCTISLRLPRVFLREEAERDAKVVDGTGKQRRRRRRRDRKV
jgi:sulfate/thiosulfate transport system ATP-binding protein